MAITYLGKGAFRSGAAAITLTMPAGIVPGDYLVMFLETANQAASPGVGWTPQPTAPLSLGTAGAAGGIKGFMFTRVVDGSEASVVINDPGDHVTGIIAAYRGVDTSNAIANNVVGTGTSSTAFTFPAITTTTPDSLIILFMALDRDANATTNVTTYTNANLTDITEVHDQTVNTGQGGGFVIAHGFKSTVGSTGTTTGTIAAATAKTYSVMALNPAPEPPPPPTVNAGAFFFIL